MRAHVREHARVCVSRCADYQWIGNAGVSACSFSSIGAGSIISHRSLLFPVECQESRIQEVHGEPTLFGHDSHVAQPVIVPLVLQPLQLTHLLHLKQHFLLKKLAKQAAAPDHDGHGNDAASVPSIAEWAIAAHIAKLHTAPTMSMSELK